MSTDTIPARSNGQTIDENWFNLLRTVLGVDHVPRNSSGVATDEGGSLGSESYQWLKAHVKSGYWSVGDIKIHHSYNGAAGPGQGWMKCDGRVINETNYNTEHGAGSWDTYIVSSVLDGKYLPDFTSKYPVGVSSTTQAGTGAITAVGNSSNQINLAHTHAVDNHRHQWYKSNNSADANDNSYDADGASVVGGSNTTKDGSHKAISWSTGVAGSVDMYTNASNPNTDSKLSSTQSIQPHSIEVQYYMRII